MAPSASAPARAMSRAPRERLDAKSRVARRRRFFWLGLLAIFLVTLVWVHVWLRLQVVHMGYVLSTTSKLQGRLEQENRELKIELATMTSPERLETIARRRLQLTQPAKGQVIILP